MLRPGLKISLLSALVLAELVTSDIAAHELPDNRVEVGLDAVVLSTRIEISYSVAMNDATMLKIEPSLGDANENEDSEEDLVRRFGPLALPAIGQGISVTVDEERFVVKPVRWEVSARHPVRFTCHYQVDLTSDAGGDEKNLKIEDCNYRELEKQLAVAMRAKQTASILSSDAALLLVRAKRNRIWELDSQGQLDAQSIRAKVSIVGDRPVSQASGIEKSEITPEAPQSRPRHENGSFLPPISVLVGLAVLVLMIFAGVVLLMRR